MRAYGKTDKGCVRPTNQDAYVIGMLGSSAVLAIVCDGMGGPGGGQIASSIAVEEIESAVREGYRPDMPSPELRELIAGGLSAANEHILARAGKEPDLFGMGTTAVVAVASESRLLIANVGDSRAYYSFGGSFAQVTRDHSVVQEMVDKGQLTKQQAQNHIQKNIITRALGADGICQPDFFERVPEKGSRILICTDGLSNLVDETELAFEVEAGDGGEETLSRLILLATARGGHDNITAVLISVEPFKG